MSLRTNGWWPMARTVTEYGPPTSRPCTRKSPFARVRAPVENPVLRCTTCTSARASGCPWASLTFPVMAPVVTPWAPAAPAARSENSAAAPRARDERTIQRMIGSLLRENGRRERWSIETGRNWPAAGAASRTLGRRFAQEMHCGRGDEEVRQPRRERRRQHPARPNGLGELEHQQHGERRGEAHADSPGRPRARRRDRERRAEQGDQQANERDRDLKRPLHAQLLRVRAAARQ